MGKTIALRLVSIVPTVIVGTFLVFILQQLVPGGPAQAILGDHATTKNIAALDKRLGLDKPLVTQYGQWLWHVLHGNFGTSYRTQTPVASSLSRALPLTLQLAVAALLISVIVGVGLGLLAATRPRGILDRAILFFSGFGVAMPDFWAAILLVIVFSIHWHLFAATGFVTINHGAGMSLRDTVLPAAALALPPIAILTRHSRGAFLTVLQAEHMRVATGLGVSNRIRLGLYLVRTAGVTITTMVGLLANGILGGTVVVEIVFAIPGMGSLIVNAALARDYPTIQGVVLVFIAIVIAINLLVDIGYPLIDPRLRS
jgi:peptide/nickel transport system permease protein